MHQQLRWWTKMCPTTSSLATIRTRIWWICLQQEQSAMTSCSNSRTSISIKTHPWRPTQTHSHHHHPHLNPNLQTRTKQMVNMLRMMMMKITTQTV
jgi:hypothetical protein